MADISLRDYLGKLDTLLNRNAPSEVVHHCRHILQYFPKNAETYRYLGRALVMSSSWEEAGEVFQRVLSVYPADYTAHLGLSDVYLHLKRPDDAIWHLERAFEQQPNDQAIIDGLRELYRRHRRVEQAKIQLTTGAVARQYIRNGLYEQAIETLRQTIDRSPERTDLRLLLAQTYQESGYRVEAAEVALEVLKTLPDCLEANRILTELWLSESRPSDAQRYLNRIQSVEPYLALELAQGGTVPDDAFRLEELDYRKAAEREINTQSPDWLREIDSTSSPASPSPTSDDPAWLGSFAPSKSADEDDLPVFDDAFSSDLPPDWLTEAAPAPAEPAQPRKKTGVTGLLNQLITDEPAPQPEVEAEEPDFESLFPSDTTTTAEELFPAEESVQQTDEPLPDLPDWFAEAPAEPETPAAPVRQTGALKETDPLAWLHESGIEIVENQQPISDDLFGADEDNLVLQDADAADPLAWLQGSGVEIVNEDVPANRGQIISDEDDLPMAASEDAADPLAWLQGSGVEVVEETPLPSASVTQTEESDPLDWLADESMLDEALDLEALIDLPATSSAPTSQIPQPEPQEEIPEPAAKVENDALDWLNSSEPVSEAPQAADDFPRMESTTEGEPLPDWFAGMSDDEPAASATEMPDWLSETATEAEAEPETASAAGGMLNWLSSDSPDEETVTDFIPEAATAPTTSETETDQFAWMSEADVDDEESSPADTGVEAMPDWLSESAPDQAYVPETPSASGIDESTYGLFSETDDEESISDTGVEAMPDWMSQSAPAEVPDLELELTSEAAEDEFSWMSSTEAVTSEPEEAVPDWLSELPPTEEEEETATTVQVTLQSTPDNLTLIEGIGPKTAAALEASGITTFAQIASTSPDDLYEMIADQGLPVIGDTETWPKQAQFLVDGDINGFHAYQDYLIRGQEPPTETATESKGDIVSESAGDDGGFEWMSEMPNSDETPEFQPTGDDGGFEWLSGSSSEAGTSEASADAPDWLSQSAPSAASQTEPDDGGIQWMSDEPQAEPAVDVPDWLSQMSPADAEDAEPEPVASTEAGGFEWMSDVSADDEPEAEPAADVPDWLSQMSPAAEAEDAEPEPVASTEAGGFEWMSDVSPDYEPEAEPAGDVPDWLSQMSPAAEAEDAEPEPVASTEAGGFEWMSDVSADDEPEAEPAADVPDWLSQISPADAQESEPEAEAVADAPEWLSQISPDDAEDAEPEVEITPEAHDWLAQARPAVAQTTTLESSDEGFPWEDSLDSEDESEAELASSEPAPEWLSSIQSSQSNAAEAPDEAPIGEGFSWMNDIQDEAGSSESAQGDFGPDAFGDAEEEVVAAPAPASNAPDWLNAMVPGLDVDYDAPEDEPIEESYVEAPAGSADKIAPIQNKREFDWLMNIVEEETQQVRAITDSGTRRRFVFSRQPAWLRKPTEAQEKPSNAPTTTAEEPDDFDDVDLPPWLQ